MFGPCNGYQGRQCVRTKHCPDTSENVEPWKHQSQSYFRKWVLPRWHMCSPPAVWAGSRIWPLMEDFMPIPPVHPWLRLSSFPAAHNVGICLGSQHPSVTSGMKEPGKGNCFWRAAQLWGFFPVWSVEMRSFPAEPQPPPTGRSLAALIVQEWNIIGGAKAEQIDPNPCLMNKNFPVYHSVHLVLNT